MGAFFKGVFMMRFYMAGLVFACCVLAYFMGHGAARSKCAADSAAAAHRMQIYTIKQQVKIDAETFNTGSADIRRVLREKYTIAE